MLFPLLSLPADAGCEKKKWRFHDAAITTQVSLMKKKGSRNNETPPVIVLIVCLFLLLCCFWPNCSCLQNGRDHLLGKTLSSLRVVPVKASFIPFTEFMQLPTAQITGESVGFSGEMLCQRVQGRGAAGQRHQQTAATPRINLDV